MDETEKDFRKAFEDVTNNNLTAVIDFCQETRVLLRGLEETVQRQSNIIVSQNKTLDEYRKQLSGIQTKVFSGGT